MSWVLSPVLSPSGIWRFLTKSLLGASIHSSVNQGSANSRSGMFGGLNEVSHESPVAARGWCQHTRVLSFARPLAFSTTEGKLSHLEGTALCPGFCSPGPCLDAAFFRASGGAWHPSPRGRSSWKEPPPWDSAPNPHMGKKSPDLHCWVVD